MSQLMERWPWPTKKQTSDPCACQPPAVKLVLWASPEDDPFRLPNKTSSIATEVGVGVVRKPRRRWSKLPLRPFPTSLSAKMGWLTGDTSSSAEAPAKQNAVFRSNSFRFERPPPDDEGRIKGPIKSYSITAQDVSYPNTFLSFSKLYQVCLPELLCNGRFSLINWFLSKDEFHKPYDS